MNLADPLVLCRNRGRQLSPEPACYWTLQTNCCTTKATSPPNNICHLSLYVNTKLECDNTLLLNGLSTIGKAEPTLPATVP